MAAKTALKSGSLLDELQATLATGTVAKRVETLRRVTDLFFVNEATYLPDQLAVFDDVFNCLIDHVEATARTLLSERMAEQQSAPPQLIWRLATDDQINVAAPVLSKSPLLDDAMLIETARTKSQQHLMAISTRDVLTNAVTDVLVERGNEAVVCSTVNNPGAQFSDQGYTKLLSRAERNDDIAAGVGMRADIPRKHYQALLAKASTSVRARLESANPQAAAVVSLAVDEAARRINNAADAAIERNANAVLGIVQELHVDGRLDEKQIVTFVQDGQFDKVTAALACIAQTPIATAETMMVQSRVEGLFVLAKIANLSWPTVRSIIQIKPKISPSGERGHEIEDRESYERLRVTTAQQVLRFQRMQQSAHATA